MLPVKTGVRLRKMGENDNQQSLGSCHKKLLNITETKFSVILKTQVYLSKTMTIDTYTCNSKCAIKDDWSFKS